LISFYTVANLILLAFSFIVPNTAFFLSAIPSVVTFVRPTSFLAPILTVIIVRKLHVSFRTERLSIE